MAKKRRAKGWTEYLRALAEKGRARKRRKARKS